MRGAVLQMLYEFSLVTDFSLVKKTDKIFEKGYVKLFVCYILNFWEDKMCLRSDRIPNFTYLEQISSF